MINLQNILTVDKEYHQRDLGLDMPVWIPIDDCNGRIEIKMDDLVFVGYTDELVTAITHHVIMNNPENAGRGLWFQPKQLMCYGNTKRPDVMTDWIGGIWEKQFDVWRYREWNSETDLFDKGMCQYWRYQLSPLARRTGGGVDESQCLSPHRTIAFANWPSHMWSIIFDNRNWVNQIHGCPPDPNARIYWAVDHSGFVKIHKRVCRGKDTENHVVDHITGATAAFPQPSDMFTLQLVLPDINDANLHKISGVYDYHPLDWGCWEPWKYRHVDQHQCAMPIWCSERAAISYSWYIEMIEQYYALVRSKKIQPIFRNNVTTHHPNGQKIIDGGYLKRKSR